MLAAYQPPFGLIFNIENTIENPDEIEPIVRFCSQPAVFNMVSAYLGEYPVLASIAFGYTAPNSSGVGSQFFHADTNEPRQLHLVMPISSIDMELGSLHVLARAQEHGGAKGHQA